MRTETRPADAIVDELARYLYETMERLDPLTPEYVAWERLSDSERDYFRECILALMNRKSLVKTLFKIL